MKTLIALLLISTAAYSQVPAPIKSATANDLLQKLAPAEDQPKTRSLGSRNIVPQPKSIDLVIQFDLDSAKLKESSKPLLDNLATAMKNERLAGVRFKVEGHTDAQGTEQHNLKLSSNRAEAVLAYLTSQGVEKDRLAGEGKGYSDLLIPDKPKAAENRRVKITTQP
jgi:outer membrane protein OmpA-like peptidoglycan-associated protein